MAIIDGKSPSGSALRKMDIEYKGKKGLTDKELTDKALANKVWIHLYPPGNPSGGWAIEVDLNELQQALQQEGICK